MIGAAAYYEYVKGNYSGLDLNAVPNLELVNGKTGYQISVKIID